MPSVYISPGDYAKFGLPSSTTADQVTNASAVVDAFLQRPEGLVWAPDANGAPCYMAGLSATYSLALPQPISPGTNVAINFPLGVGSPVQQVQPGDVLILDAANPSRTEAVIVQSSPFVVPSAPVPNPPPNGPVIFVQVQFQHDAGALLEAGRVIEEMRYMPDNRPVTSVSRKPLMRILSGVGRYAYGRRGDAANYNMEQFNLLAALSKFGGPPAWEIFSPLITGWDMGTGQVWIPAGIMLAYYSEVKLRYVAGFNLANLPRAVQVATAKALIAAKALPTAGNVKRYKAGDTEIELFASTVFDADMQQQLGSYRADSWA